MARRASTSTTDTPAEKPKRQSRKKGTAPPSPLDLLNGKTPEAEAPVEAAPVEAQEASGAQGSGYFTSVSGVVKGAQFHLPLAPCTAIVGENRAGKTRVLDAFRLAVTGEHPIGRAAADRLALGLGDQPPEVRVGNQRAAEALDKATRKQLIPGATGASLLSMGPALLREALFNRFGKQLDITLSPPDTLDERGKAAFTALVQQADPFLAVGAALAAGRRDLLKLTADQTAIEGTIAGYDAQLAQVGAVGPDEESRLVAGLASAQVDPGAARLRASLRARKAEIEAALPAGMAVYAPLRDLPDVAPDDPTIEALRVELRHAEADRDAVVAHGTDPTSDGLVSSILAIHDLSRARSVCLVCERPLAPGLDSAQIAAWRTRRVDALNHAEAVAAANEHVARLTAQVKMAEDAHKAAHAQRVKVRDAVKARLLAAKTELEQIAMNLQTLGGDAAPAPGVNVDVPAIEARLADVRAALAIEAQRTVALEQRRGLAGQRAALTALTQALDTVATGLVQGLKRAVELAVNAWMPGGLTAVLLVGESQCEFAMIGSDGTPHPQGAMSGAERGALCLALSLAWSDGLPLRVLLLDDADLAHFSPANVRLVLEKVTEWQRAGRITQALVAWSRAAEIPTDGWLVHTVGGA